MFTLFTANGGSPDEIPAPGGKILGAGIFKLSFKPYNKPSLLFMGHKQTVQTKIRYHSLWHLIRVFTVCLQNVLLKGVLASVPTHGFSLNFAY